MKKYIKYLLFFAMAISLASCEEDNSVNKDSVDTKYDSSLAPAAPVVNLNNVFEVQLTFDFSPIDNVTNQGIIYSTKEEDCIITRAKKVESSASKIVVGELAESTTYYYRSFAANQHGYTLGDVKTAVTGTLPVFEDEYLFGVYTEMDFDLETGQTDSENTYVEAVTIRKKQGTFNKIELVNFWDAGGTIEGTVDFEKKTITIMPQVLFKHATYGDCYALAIVKTDDGKLAISPTAPIIATYTEEGVITTDMWAAKVDAGTFGVYAGTILQKVKGLE